MLLSDLNKKLALLRSHVLHLQEEEGEAEEEEETPHAHASMHQAEFSEHPEVPPQGPPTQEFVGAFVGEFVRGAASGEKPEAVVVPLEASGGGGGGLGVGGHGSMVEAGGVEDGQGRRGGRGGRAGGWRGGKFVGELEGELVEARLTCRQALALCKRSTGKVQSEEAENMMGSLLHSLIHNAQLGGRRGLREGGGTGGARGRERADGIGGCGRGGRGGGGGGGGGGCAATAAGEWKQFVESLMREAVSNIMGQVCLHRLLSQLLRANSQERLTCVSNVCLCV